MELLKRHHRVLAMLVLAAAPAARGVTYDTLVYPLIAATGTADPSAVAGNQAVGWEQYTVGQTTYQNALLWSAASASVTGINLNPTGYSNSQAQGTDGTNQVGAASGYLSGGASHAMLWAGTASSYVDLNPTSLPGINNSSAVSVSGNQQFGVGGNASSGNLHPILWTGTAASAVDLAPTNLATQFVSYEAEATDGTNQVGAGNTLGALQINGWHALLWSGKAGTAIDLTPTDYPSLVNSYAYGVGGNQQVGVAYGQQSNDPFGGPYYQAMLWNGSGASAVELNPSNQFTLYGCEALATNGSQQVGVGRGGTSIGNALVWSGTAASMVNLQTFLPSTGTWNGSSARSISSSGDVGGLATGTFDGMNGSFGVTWVPANASNAIVVTTGETYQIASANTGSVSSRTINGLTVNASGSAIAQPAVNSSNRQLFVINGSGLSLAGVTGNWTGKLNLADNDLDLTGASPAAVTDQIRQGYSNGTWNGSGGITSTSAAADLRHLTALGVIQNNQGGSALYTTFDGNSVGSGDVLVKYTYYGDANLNGKVDGTDYSRIDNGLLQHLTGWFNGDFNYDGIINGSDYTLIDNSFNTQGASLSGEVAGGTAQVAGATVVPEPGCLVMAAAGLLFLRRPRKLLHRSGTAR